MCEGCGSPQHKSCWSERSYLIQGSGERRLGTFGRWRAPLSPHFLLAPSSAVSAPWALHAKRPCESWPPATSDISEPLFEGLIACHFLLRAPASHVTRWSAGAVGAGSFCCGGGCQQAGPGLNQQQRTGAVFAGAGCRPSMCACQCEFARTCGPGRCPQLRSQWTSGSGAGTWV